MSFSGGGTRAAAFAFGVLEALRETSFGPPAKPVRLLDEVDLIAAVSGGGITASYYALFGERLFQDFPRRFLEKNVQGALLRRLFWPRNWFRLASGNYERVDLVAGYLDRRLFDGKTFEQLGAGRPFVMISATDISRGVPFPFTQDRFDLLCSDLEGYPVARAVTASAAVPVLLTPITLRNYGWAACGYREPDCPETTAPAGPVPPRAVRARCSYRDGEERPWVHLFDGGLADNLGLQALLDSAFSADPPCSANRLKPAGRKVVVIVVNAVTTLDRSVDKKKQGPSLAQTVWAAANVPIDQHAFSTIESLRPRLQAWWRQQRACDGDVAAGDEDDDWPPEIYPIVVDFAAVRGFDPASSDRLEQIPTAFHLRPEQAREVRAAGAEVLRRAPEFQRLLTDVGGSARPPGAAGARDRHAGPGTGQRPAAQRR